MNGLSQLDLLIFDKTGTLTTGSFDVQDVYFDKNEKKDYILKLVAALETKSNHPLANALQRFTVGCVSDKVSLQFTSSRSGNKNRQTFHSGLFFQKPYEMRRVKARVKNKERRSCFVVALFFVHLFFHSFFNLDLMLV